MADRRGWSTLDVAKLRVNLTYDNLGEALDLLRYGFAGGSLADGVYNVRRGIPRLLDIFDRHGVSVTFFLEGWNVRKYPDIVREITSRGHEVAGHGWMHETWQELSPENERELVARTTAAITDITGRAPRGWRTPSGLMTRQTLALLSEFGYRYDSSFIDEDRPYRLAVDPQKAREIIELPFSWSINDSPYFNYPGVTLRAPSEVLRIWREETASIADYDGYVMMTSHPRFIGRPGRVGILEEYLGWLAARGDTWVGRADTLVDWLVDGERELPAYPYPEVARP